MTTISGIVIPGQQRARRLGFPTANISCTLNMKEGVYAGLTSISGKALPSIKTLAYYKDNLLEAHLIGRNVDLYGRILTIHLTHFVRPPLPYHNDQVMTVQIEEDQRYILAHCFK